MVTRRLIDQLTILGFVGTIFASLVVTIINRQDTFLAAEKRSRVGRPNFSLQQWFTATWQPAFERYFNDRFGGRDTAVRWNNLTHIAAFGLSPVKLVMAGRDGQLLYAAEETIEDFRNLQPFTAAEQATLTERVLSMRDEAKRRGAAFVVLIAPNTATVYPDTVPTRFNRLTEASRFDQAVAIMEAAGVAVVDPRDDLRQAAATNRVYHLTDTHWNDRGGYIAYAKTLKRLQAAMPGLSPTPFEAFTISTGWTQGGDLATALSMADLYPTQSEWLVPKKATRAALVEAAYPEANLIRPPKVTEVPDPSLPSAVVFRDSFSKAIEPLLSEHFRRVAFIRSPHFVPNVLDVEQPDVIILEIAERYLSKIVNGGETAEPSSPPTVGH